MATILVLHGPNLNLLGEREPEIYGQTTLGDINQTLQQQARDAGHHLLYVQSNADYELVERSPAGCPGGSGHPFYRDSSVQCACA